jgi:hypothetical protein
LIEAAECDHVFGEDVDVGEVGHVCCSIACCWCS